MVPRGRGKSEMVGYSHLWGKGGNDGLIVVPEGKGEGLNGGLIVVTGRGGRGEIY